MRIDELCLDAFGPFSDRRLSLAEDGDAGLCLVYGPNEAGKSSALRAIRGLLYGIEHDSTDNFIHPHTDLRIAARLRFQDGFAARLVRRKGRKQTLTGEGEHGEEAVQRLMALTQSIPERLFHHFYGLDHPGLVEGSQQLLEDGGELSRALFGAGLGIVHLRKVIEGLESEAEALFVPRGQKQRIAVALAEWKEIQGEIRATTLEPSRFEEQARRTRELEARFNELEQELADVQVELSRARRRRDAELALAQARQAREQALARIERESGRQAALVLAPELLAAREPIEDLHQRLRSYREAREQLPRRVERLTELDEELASLEAALGPELAAAPEATLKRISDRTARVRALVSESVRCADRLEKAKEAERDARRELERLRALEQELRAPVGEGDLDLVPLEAAQKRAQRLGPIDDEIEETSRSLAALDGEVTRLRERLGLRGLSDDALEALSIPTRASIERHARRFADLADEGSRRRQEREARSEERRGVREELGRLRGEGRLPSEHALMDERAVRDGLWRRLRARLEGGVLPSDEPIEVPSLTAAFETALFGVDRLADRLRSEASRVARGAELAARAARLDEALADGDRELSRLGTVGDALEAAWRADWPAALGDPGPPEGRIAWRGELDRLLELLERRRGLVERSTRQLALRRTAREGLCEVLGASGAGATSAPGGAGDALWPWLERAERAHAIALEGRQRRRDAAQAVAQAEHQLERAVVANLQAAEQLARAEALWQAERIALALPEATRPEQADARLDAIGSLLERRREAEALRRRVEQMGQLVARFETQCAALVASHRLSIADFAPEVAALRLKHELDQAREQATLAEAIATALADARHDLARVERQVAICRADRLALAAEGETPEAEDLDRQNAQIAQLEARVHDRQEERVRCAEALSLERAALAAMDGNARIAELAERAESRLAGVRGDVVRYAELRLARQILEQEIEAYRRANQGPLVEHAGRLFGELTRGAYTTVLSDAGDDGKARLLARSAAGREVPIEALSSGTRDQLFLALRLAALSASVERAEPMPLVADDILIEFDDERTRATLEVLARVSERTQILLFTHHRHVVDQASALGERVRIVEL